eukprot:365425-Chlamydomonas_euryale.AAC.20
MLVWMQRQCQGTERARRPCDGREAARWRTCPGGHASKAVGKGWKWGNQRSATSAPLASRSSANGRFSFGMRPCTYAAQRGAFGRVLARQRGRRQDDDCHLPHPAPSPRAPQKWMGFGVCLTARCRHWRVVRR